MRSKVLFYLVWDVLFFTQLYVFSSWDRLVKAYAQQTFEFQLQFWLQLFWMAVIGGFIGVLAVKSRQYQTDKKSAVLELALIGIPTLYCAAVPALVYQIGINIKFFLWLFSYPMMAAVCGILFGYELFVFLFKMFRSKEQN